MCGIEIEGNGWDELVYVCVRELDLKLTARDEVARDINVVFRVELKFREGIKRLLW